MLTPLCSCGEPSVRVLDKFSVCTKGCNPVRGTDTTCPCGAESSVVDGVVFVCKDQGDKCFKCPRDLQLMNMRARLTLVRTMFFSPDAADLFQTHTSAALEKHEILKPAPIRNKRLREESADKRPCGRLVIDDCTLTVVEIEQKGRTTPLPLVKIDSPSGCITVRVVNAIYAVTAPFVHMAHLMTIDQKSEAWHDARSISFQVNDGQIWKVSRFTGTSMGDIYQHDQDMLQTAFADVYRPIQTALELSMFMDEDAKADEEVQQILDRLKNDRLRTPIKRWMELANKLISADAFEANPYMRYGVAMEDTACQQMMQHLGFLHAQKGLVSVMEPSGICINRDDPTLASSADMIISTVGPASNTPFFAEDDRRQTGVQQKLIARDWRIGECKAMAAASTRLYDGSMGDEQNQVVQAPGCSNVWIHATHVTPSSDIDKIIDGVVDIGLIEKWLDRQLADKNVPEQEKWISNSLGQTPDARRKRVAERVGIGRLTFEQPKSHFQQTPDTYVAEDKYTLQMMLNMHNTDAKVCYYLRWAVHAFLVQRVNYNKDLFAKVLEQVKTFREKIYWPMLCVAVNAQAHR